LDGDQLETLALGLSEEITAAISRFRWISCVDGTMPAADGGLAKPGGHAWQRHDLDFLLDSTLQRSGNRIRVIARLLDVRAGGKVVWVRRFDRELDDVLTLQGEIAAEAAAQIDPELLLREGERLILRGSHEPSAYNLVLRAIPAIYRLERSGFQTAGEMFAAALAIEPGNAAAHAWWAYWHVLLVGQGWAGDPIAATRRAGELSERAVMLDPADARALALVGHVRGFLFKRPEEARALHERAISINPNLPLAWCFSGADNSCLGRHEEAIARINHAQRLSPHDPHAFFFDATLMLPHLLCGDFEIVVTLGRRAIELNPGFSATYKGYLAALGHLGRDGEAARVLARLLTLEPGFSIRNAIERSPMTRPEDLALYAEGLRRAGLREG
jgi:TolB-like protein